MIAFKHILCPIDFSDTSVHALGHAAAIATWYGAELTVLHVTDRFESAPAGQATDSARTRDGITARILRAVERAGAGSLNPRPLAQSGHAAELIVNGADTLNADLLVIGTHGVGGFRERLLGSVTEKVMRTAGCPVLTVPPPAPAIPGAVVFKKILCPIDYSPSSLTALAYALELGRQGHGHVTVLNALEYMEPEELCEHVDFDIRRQREHFLEHARERLHTQLASEEHAGCAIDEIVVVSRAYKAILERATDQGADLIVMGAQGTGGIQLMLYGSNTEHVVRAAVCPVLTVRA